MTPVKRGRHRDPIDCTMEHALRLGNFINYNASWSFVTDLEELAKQIEQVLQRRVSPGRSGRPRLAD